MANQQLLSRLEAIRLATLAKYEGGKGMSSVTTGAEREAFNKTLLEMVMAPPFRIGSGEITDSESRQSGPLDLVIEHSGSISFPMESNGRRLYIAEGVAAVVEVKSNLVSQWSSAVDEAKKVNVLRRKFGSTISFGAGPTPTIPVVVAGFVGWKEAQSYLEKINEPSIDAILSLDPPICISKSGVRASGPASLLGFFNYLQTHMKSLLGGSPNYDLYVN